MFPMSVCLKLQIYWQKVMDDMYIELVIKISEEDYFLINRNNFCRNKWKVYDAIKNGTPLPKGHGDLIDRQALIDNGIEKGFCNWYDEIKYADTIIEADKTESEANNG